ncbi:polysaccharide lyase [Spirosoma sp.]|uniref:polysaccharide lyase n=1 Tax=Spirosoma sp. TaxID=1899569 RepID=UPI00262F433A|nr:polysaccharide lyase [Spirosoma sp.]
MLTTVFSLLVNLTSCTPIDTAAPPETHSAAREEASILFKDNFENDNIASFWRPNFWTPTAGLITKEIKRSGKKSLRISWMLSQVDGTNKMKHSELSSKPLDNGETERWYGYSSYMPSSSMADDDQTVIVTQWHGQPDPGFEDTVPPVAISVEPGNKLQLVYRAMNKPIVRSMQGPTSQVYKDLGAAIFDKWVDYVVHIKWDPIGYKGILQVWQNGELKINEQGIQIGYMQELKPFWKAGLYCWTGKSKYAEKVIYYDEMRIGNAIAGYDAVKPGRDDNSARTHD